MKDVLCLNWNSFGDNFLSFPWVLFSFSLSIYCHTDPAQTHEKQAGVCEPYVLSNGVRVQASLACINSPCQEVAFDPNTQNLAQNMADTKYIHVGEGCALAGKCLCVTQCSRL